MDREPLFCCRCLFVQNKADLDENECEWTKKEFITRPARAGCLQNINYYDNLCGMIIVYTYQY